VTGTLLGIVLLGMLSPALTFMGVSPYWEQALQGLILLAAVALDALPSFIGRGRPPRPGASHAPA
jgi:rhamnose transport system permease protein